MGCYYNQLTSLDVSNNADLDYVYCTHNQLTSLDLSSCTVLTSVQCHNNNLTLLNLGSNINLNTLALTAANNGTAMIIRVGTTARVTQANSLFNAGTNFDDGTINTI